jgi:hypothetical protein
MPLVHSGATDSQGFGDGFGSPDGIEDGVAYVAVLPAHVTHSM